VATGQQTTTDEWWMALPAASVVKLTGPDPSLITLSLDPLPASAPAVISIDPLPAESLEEQAGQLIAALENTAMALTPRWLPRITEISGPRGAGRAAARVLASSLAADRFGQLRAAVAEASLDSAVPLTASVPAEIRAAGTARMIAEAYRRDGLAVLVHTPNAWPPSQERVLAAALEWLADHGQLSVWLLGAPLDAVDRIETVTVRLSEPLAELAAEIDPAPGARDGVRYPPPIGAPHPASRAEQALESALASLEWAAGRAWNQTYQSHVLASSFRLDLWWPAERLVVEIDGPEHRDAAKYADDRRRDTQLTLDGLTVVRFTNAHVLDDTAMVTSQIERLLRGRRPERGGSHAHG
jgi:very-short-patch-repair endonuclease